MDSSSVLLALEEGERWRERRRRIEGRLREIARRRAFLSRELDYVRTRIAEYATILRQPREPALPLETPVPMRPLLR
jgi:hypothetical protein